MSVSVLGLWVMLGAWTATEFVIAGWRAHGVRADAILALLLFVLAATVVAYLEKWVQS